MIAPKAPMGKRYLQDVFETMGVYVNGLRFAGSSFSLMPPKVVREIIDLCHQNGALVSPGGFCGVQELGVDLSHSRTLDYPIRYFLALSPAEGWIRLM